MAMLLSAERSNRALIFEWWRSVDRVMITIFLTLIMAGLILSLAASPPASARLGYENPFFFFGRHVFFVSAGIGGAFIVSLMSPKNARRIGVLSLLGAMILMCAVLMVGYEVKGATRWLRFLGFSLQPSEFAKPGFIVFSAWMFAHRKKDLKFPGLVFVLVTYFTLIALLIRQPDFGQSFLLTLCFGAVFFFAGLSLGWMLIMASLSAFAAFSAYMFMPHVNDRINRFINPDGSDTYQTDKALEAISNGGFFGRGPGEGKVKDQLPDAHTDFIFAVAVEEFGFFISFILIVLIACLVGQAFRKALRINDHFSQLAVAGLATMIGVQAIINLAVNLNMLPPKGMTLPFISYGGSSMLALCFSVGLILAFTRTRPGAYGYGAMR